MLSVDKGYRKRGIGMYGGALVLCQVLTQLRCSIRAGTPFDQCHAGERSTGGKKNAT
jgi:hypothetical protein